MRESVQKALKKAEGTKFNVREHDRKGAKGVKQHKRSATKSEKSAIVADELLKSSHIPKWKQALPTQIDTAKAKGMLADSKSNLQKFDRPTKGGDRQSQLMRDLDENPGGLADNYSVEELVKAAESIGGDMERTTEKIRGAAKDMKSEADAIDQASTNKDEPYRLNFKVGQTLKNPKRNGKASITQISECGQFATAKVEDGHGLEKGATLQISIYDSMFGGSVLPLGWEE